MVFEGILQGFIAMAAVGAIVLVIYAKAIKNNPKISDIVAMFNPGELYQKVPILPEAKERVEQVYEERRKMI